VPLSMQRIGAALQRRGQLVIGIWAVLVIAALPFAARQTNHLTGGGFEDPYAQSTAVSQTVAREFPGEGTNVLNVVVAPSRGAHRTDLLRAIDQVVVRVRRVGGVGLVRPSALCTALASARRLPLRAAVIRLSFTGDETSAIDLATKLRSELGISAHAPGSAAGGRVAVDVVGQGALWAAFQQQTKADAKLAEAKAFPLIALLLLLVFGSLAATVLPLLLGAAAVILTGAAIYGLSLVTSVSLFVTNTASLVGIGVAVDYSLFVLVRYREEISAGRSPDQARMCALKTSGVAVLYSALTVIASLSAIFLIDSTAMRSIAVGAIIVVATSALEASLILPALLALLGERVTTARRFTGRRWWSARAHTGGTSFWTSWARAVMRRPALSAIGSIALLLVLASPVRDLRMEYYALSELPPDSEILQGVHTIARILGPGATGPILVTVDFSGEGADSPAARRMLDVLGAAIRADPSVSYVAPTLISADPHTALIRAVLSVDPESQAARATVRRLRVRLPALLRDQGQTQVGGTTAGLVDFGDLVEHSLWKIIVFVLALELVMLVVVLRSIVLPIKAVLTNLLSVATGYGAIVAIFQWGWLPVLGFHRVTSIEAISPPLILVITLGLSMDYEIFLLTRIREHYLASRDNRAAVAEGLAGSARTITGAAVIMMAVCIAFLGSGIGALQRLGLATAVTIGIDATIVRLVLVPAMMTLLGSWNWWLPELLARPLSAFDHRASDAAEQELAA
jgi:uncharacterized membrane protein YdfJ with MMPL/SSD domain